VNKRKQAESMEGDHTLSVTRGEIANKDGHETVLLRCSTWEDLDRRLGISGDTPKADAAAKFCSNEKRPDSSSVKKRLGILIDRDDDDEISDKLNQALPELLLCDPQSVLRSPITQTAKLSFQATGERSTATVRYEGKIYKVDVGPDAMALTESAAP
jgi:hypothetical protein